MKLKLDIQFGSSGLIGADATLPAVEVQGVGQELVKTEMLGTLAVISAKHQKQMFVMTRTAQVLSFEDF